MKIFKSAISILKRLFPGWTVLLLVASMLVFSACKSGDLEETTSEAPSTTMGVDFEKPVEHASGENPTTIINGDWDNDSRTDLMVLNPRKQSGTSSVEEVATSPMPKTDAMNRFLESLDISFRKDEKTSRHRVNKEASRLDKEQKSSGNYYFRK